jgi:hypothetical protein
MKLTNCRLGGWQSLGNMQGFNVGVDVNASDRYFLILLTLVQVILKIIKLVQEQVYEALKRETSLLKQLPELCGCTAGKAPDLAAWADDEE